jgi:hypothetical protein
MHILPIGSIIGPAHLVQENTSVGGINSVWLVHNNVNLVTYRTFYKCYYNVLFRCETVRMLIELYHSIFTLYIITPRESRSRCTGTDLQMGVVVPVSSKFYQLQGMILFNSKDNFIIMQSILVLCFAPLETLRNTQKYFSEDLRSTDCCILEVQ